MKDKESPEEIAQRLNTYDPFELHYPEYVFELCEAYHQERLKSSLPSEEDKNKAVYDWIMKVDHEPNSNETWAYRQGFKDALYLLTKGGK